MAKNSEGAPSKAEYDVFISYASEDRKDVVTPLARILRRRGIKVWLDRFKLTLGDSLRRSIDEGLAGSRFGVVVLSPKFFAKDWPQKELDALVAREDGSEKVILPIWHNIGREEIVRYSPLLGDKLAVSTADGIKAVADEVQLAISRDQESDGPGLEEAHATKRSSTTKPSKPKPKQAANLSELLGRQSQAAADVRELSNRINNEKEPATIVFFDLVGSTGYRVSEGSERGLEKAHQHNQIVSAAILDGAGIVVKWLGDGVMGVFRGKDMTWAAFKASLDALDRLEKYNKDTFPRASQQADRIISRVGIQDGDVHFLTVPSPDGSELTIDDPMGEAADLAFRLQSLAGDSVILLTKSGFQQIAASDNTPVRMIPLHREPKFARTYRPSAACYAVEVSGLKHLGLTPAANQLAVTTDELWDLAKNEAENGNSIVFASDTIMCNVKGFRQQIPVVAVSRTPRREPVAEREYAAPRSKKVRELLDEAEEHYRAGEEEEAFRLFKEVFDIDSRNFPANFRLAQYYQKHNDPEQARQHWMTAKHSNPHHPRVWAMAGVYHLQKALELVEGLGDPQEELEGAITDFEKSSRLALDNFDTTLEHYCVCLLAISLLIRRGPDDVDEGKDLVDQLENWHHSSNLVAILHPIAKVLSVAASGTSNEISKASDATIPEAKQRLSECRFMNGDTIQRDEMDLLISMAETRLKLARKKAKQQVAKDDKAEPATSARKKKKA